MIVLFDTERNSSFGGKPYELVSYFVWILSWGGLVLEELGLAALKAKLGSS